ncbi:PREDICTED: alpha-soluble NSF attachment protein, partial [Pseudopodoces humilis]|uniref:alpha-soluble NSF attachment protein n=1 Tax=Pseudopodoces humilis TaxID=181119 RepID=UPI0003957081
MAAMAAGKEEEAQRLLNEAERRLRGARSFLGGLFGGSSRLEEASDCFTRAANMFKMAKNWSQAGAAFSRAAQLQLQLQSKHDAAVNFVDAGNAFKKSDPQEAVNCLLRATEIYTDMAIAHYEQAADYYKGEESTSSANKCLLKVAAFAAQLEQFPRAIDIYEQVGAVAMDSPLLKYGAKEHFLRAALCHCCVDTLNAR